MADFKIQPGQAIWFRGKQYLQGQEKALAAAGWSEAQKARKHATGVVVWKGAAKDQAQAAAEAPSEPDPARTGAGAEETAPGAASRPEAAGEPSAAQRDPDNGPDATDAAWALAEERGVDLRAVPGTGTGGRITKGDVEAYLETPPSGGPSAPAK